jgi:hypothetical protein
MDYGSLDQDLIETAIDLAKLADRRPSNTDWGSTLTWELGKLVQQLEETADHESIKRLKWLVTLMTDGALPKQTKLSRLHEVLNDINPEHPRNPADAERIELLKGYGEIAQAARLQVELRNAFNHWRRTFRERHFENECAVRYMLASRAWKVWTRAANEKQLQRKYFLLWQVKTRLKIAIEDRNKVFMAEKLQQWREAAQHRARLRIAEQHYQIKIKSKLLQQLNTKAHHSAQLRQTAQASRERKLKQLAMDHIVDHIEHIKMLDRRVKAAEFYRLTSRSLNTLRAKAAEKIATKQEESRKAELTQRYTTYCQEKQVTVASVYLTRWRERCQLETSERISLEEQLTTRAGHFYQTRLFTKSIAALTSHHNRAQNLSSTADEFYMSKSRLKALEILQKCLA